MQACAIMFIVVYFRLYWTLQHDMCRRCIGFHLAFRTEFHTKWICILSSFEILKFVSLISYMLRVGLVDTEWSMFYKYILRHHSWSIVKFLLPWLNLIVVLVFKVTFILGFIPYHKFSSRPINAGRNQLWLTCITFDTTEYNCMEQVTIAWLFVSDAQCFCVGIINKSMMFIMFRLISLGI